MIGKTGIKITSAIGRSPTKRTVNDVARPRIRAKTSAACDVNGRLMNPILGFIRFFAVTAISIACRFASLAHTKLIHDPVTIWIVVGPVAWLYWQAIRSEEEQMQKLFPQQWPQYAAAVPRFIPRLPLLQRAADWSLDQWLRNSEYQALLGSIAALAGLKLWQLWL